VVKSGPQQAVVVSDVVGQRGGAYRVTALLSEALCDLGLQTTTFVRWVEPDFVVPAQRWRVMQPLITRGCRWALPERFLARQAAAFINREQPAITIVVGLTSLCARLLTRVPRGLVWVWELTNAERGNKFVDPRVISQLDRVRGLLSPANIIDNAIRSNYGYGGCIERLPFWIEPGPEHYLPPPEKFRCDFLFLSRREDDKGLADLIQATAIAAASDRNLSVLIAGAGPAERYQALAEQLRVTHIVEFVSLASRIDAMNVLSQARYVVLPSHHEGFPISILEGTQRSVPFIATPVGAIPEMLGHDGACLYHEPRNVQRLAELMLQATAEPIEEYIGRRQAAHNRFNATLSLNAIRTVLTRLNESGSTT
jgi:glycosyltransferase involved in cell wall biosynthesis